MVTTSILNPELSLTNEATPKIACRNALTKTLERIALINSSIFVVTSDARGSVSLNSFAEKLPNQFVEVGIAEQNAVGISAGLANLGLTVFTCGPACFYSARSAEQVKNDIAYMNSSVIIAGVSGGVSYGALGSTHHSLHDVALFRAIPNIQVLLPCDDVQTEAMVEHLANNPQPTYLRIGRNPVPRIYNADSYVYTHGQAKLLAEGNDGAIIACGEMVYHGLVASHLLREQGIHLRVIDSSSIVPLDEQIILEAARETGELFVLEEHSIHGGLGGAVAELVGAHEPVPVHPLGFPNEFAPAGNTKQLLDHYKLNGAGVAGKIKQILSGK